METCLPVEMAQRVVGYAARVGLVGLGLRMPLLCLIWSADSSHMS